LEAGLVVGEHLEEFSQRGDRPSSHAKKDRLGQYRMSTGCKHQAFD
jgi:hypothetical protein